MWNMNNFFQRNGLGTIYLRSFPGHLITYSIGLRHTRKKRRRFVEQTEHHVCHIKRIPNIVIDRYFDFILYHSAPSRFQQIFSFLFLCPMLKRHKNVLSTLTLTVKSVAFCRKSNSAVTQYILS